MLAAGKVYAHDTDGFYVIPVPTDEVVKQEVCNGTVIGDVAFTIVISDFSVSLRDVYFTESGRLIEITGLSIGDLFTSDVDSLSFRVSPSTLPPPPTINGVAGPFFTVLDGRVAHARFL